MEAMILNLLSATPALLLLYLLADKYGSSIMDRLFPKPTKKTTEDRVIEALERTSATNAQLAQTMSQLQDTMQEHGAVLRGISGAVAHLYGYLQLEPPTSKRERGR